MKLSKYTCDLSYTLLFISVGLKHIEDIKITFSRNQYQQTYLIRYNILVAKIYLLLLACQLI